MTRPVLLTGASGALGRILTGGLAAQGFELRLTDIAPFPGDLPPGASFTVLDLNDGVSLLRLAEGCGTILHFGGISVDRPFEEVLGPNIRGVHHIYEAARREHARVVFASSNHSIGFHERTTVLDAGCAFRPDSFYGLSKAYGELMGRLYWDKHGVENVNIRIGSSFPAPVDARMLATWLSYADLTSMMAACIRAEHVGHAVIWGASANPRMTWWRDDHRSRIAWAPADSAEGFADMVGGKLSGNPVSERYQGGGYCAAGYSRASPSPADPFAE